MVASVTIVSGRPSGVEAERASRGSPPRCRCPRRRRSCMTMVRVSGQLNSARTGTPQVRLSRNVTSTTSTCSSTGLVVDDQVAERVRVEPRAVPRVEPVGDHVLRLADARAGRSPR